MKLLFDQNISFRLVDKLSDDLPEAWQVTQLGLTNATDREIWEYARKNDLAIVTFDADFYDLVTFFGHPPKVIWLRTGNRSTANLAKVLNDRAYLIQAFLTSEGDQDIACLEIK